MVGTGEVEIKYNPYLQETHSSTDKMKRMKEIIAE